MKTQRVDPLRGIVDEPQASASVGQSVVQPLVRRCLTCAYWEGDRAATQARIDEHGYELVMDWDRGFPFSGDCDRRTDWLEIDINGDASVNVSVPANFGCLLHSDS